MLRKFIIQKGSKMDSLPHNINKNVSQADWHLYKKKNALTLLEENVAHHQKTIA